MDANQVEFLSKFSLLVNSSLEVQKVATVALQHLRTMLEAEASTVFLVDDNASTITFWALHGDKKSTLEGRKIPQGKGIVGWVITERKGVVVKNVKEDSRFFQDVDREEGFETRDLICVPLILHGKKVIGAIQVLNSTGKPFSNENLQFVEQLSHQIAIAIENARLHASITEHSRKLEILGQKKDDMISVITHEFRTPLSIIQNSAEMLTGGTITDKETLEVMCDTLQKGVNRLTKLVTQIRNISLVGEHKLALEPCVLDIGQLLQQLPQKFAEALEKRKLTISTEIEPGLPCISADPGMLVILLNNLVSNAIRFTADGGNVTIYAEHELGLVKIGVRDTGIGIAADQIPMVFEKFYEVGLAAHHSSGDFGFKSGGLGLGLATGRAILRAHGSDLLVSSTPGKGSNFHFSLKAV